MTFDLTGHDDRDHQDFGNNVARIFCRTGISPSCHPDLPENHPALPEKHPEDLQGLLQLMSGTRRGALQ